MDRIPKIDRDLPYQQSLLPDPNQSGEVRRQIIIDGANVIHSTAPYDPERKRKLPFLGLLSLMRTLVKNDFEVIVFLSPKYLHKNVVNERSLEKFLELTEFHIIDQGGPHVLDDLMMLEMAWRCQGVVLSKDRFRDHCKAFDHYNAIVATNYGQLDYQVARPEWRRTMTTDGHYIEYHMFKFPHHDRLYSNPRALTHEIAVESYSYWNPERKAEILEKMDEILLELRVYEQV